MGDRLSTHSGPIVADTGPAFARSSEGGDHAFRINPANKVVRRVEDIGVAFRPDGDPGRVIELSAHRRAVIALIAGAGQGRVMTPSTSALKANLNGLKTGSTRDEILN